jgi:predicted Zn-dependent peptidase
VVAVSLGEQELLSEEILSPADVIRRIEAVTVEDVQRVARRLCSDGLRAAIVGNFRRPERFESLLAEPLL